MRENQKILFRGEGDQMPDVEPGDIVIILQQKPHEKFQRNNDNLQINQTISLTEALCGFTFVLHHLDGRDLVIRHPAGEVIKPGDIKTVVGEGMPCYKDPFEKGNLHICFSIKFPDSHFTTKENLKLLESIFPPRPEFVMPTGDHVEQVDLYDFVPNDTSSDSRSGDAYASDEEDGIHSPGIQCATQ